ncbi:MAG: bifunctional 5,10-methylenetetrahydrofolate dehydrogenase/5,10-methenyltetrahydrofolate cyclohydrolase [Patescibacteria group bacterium]
MKIDGREIANKILEELKTKIKKLKAENIVPHLAIILIGNDPASIAYVKQKILTAEKIGIKTSLSKFPSSVSTKKLLGRLSELNRLGSVHGIIVQQPLPSHIDLIEITNSINTKKDVDGFHPNSKFQPPIALAVLRILEEVFKRLRLGQGVTLTALTNWLKSKKIVVIGKGETGGKPIIDILKKINVKPSIIDSKTPNSQNLTKTADIIISAVGKSNVIKPEIIKKNSILISIGLSKGKDGKLHGDYDEEKIKYIASFYTPTPGGVGPLNVAMLLENLVRAVENS